MDMKEKTRTELDECLAAGENPADFFWAFNGLRPSGEQMSMDMAEFVLFANALHPEYVDEETGAPLLYDFVFTKTDAELTGDEGLAGTVMVTIRPDLDGKTNWTQVAIDAASRYPANKAIRERFMELAKMFSERGM